MSRLRVNAFSISIDGYGAGPGQDLDNPMGVGGMALHTWVFGTRTFKKMHGDLAEALIGDEAARGGVDDDFAARGFENLGAWILGRNMFGPMRGPWSDDGWKGWWGPNPPYHVPVFVLTHHARAPITMEGGTTFHFVTDGIHAALERRPKRLRARTFDSVAASPPFASTSSRVWSTRSTSRSPPCCSVGASTSSGASTWSASATSARSTSPRATPRTSS